MLRRGRDRSAAHLLLPWLSPWGYARLGPSTVRSGVVLGCSQAALKRLSLLRFPAEEVPARSYSTARPQVSFQGARKDRGALEQKTTVVLRKLSPPPLFLLPPLPGGGRGGPVQGLMLGGRERLAGMDLGAEKYDRLLHALHPLLLLLLQGLLRLDGVREEELEGGVVDGFACRDGQQRHGQRRRRGSHVPVRDCRAPRLGLRRETRPLPREWRLQCP